MPSDALNLEDFMEDTVKETPVVETPTVEPTEVKQEEVKTEEAPTEVTPPVEVKPVEEVKTEAPVFEPLPIKPATTPERDYSVFGEDKDVASVARNMSNDAFAKFVELYKQSKTAQQPPTLEDHPEAFVLDNDFRRAQIQHLLCQKDESHWRAQIKKISEGEDWEFLSYDNEGNPVLEKREATEQALEEVQEHLATAMAYKSRAQESMQELQNNFTERHQNRAKTFRDVEKQLLGDEYVDYDALLKRSEPAKKMDGYLAQNGQKANILAPTVVKLYDVIMQMMQSNQSMAAELQKYKTTPLAQGPVEGQVKEAPLKKSENILSLESFLN